MNSITPLLYPTFGSLFGFIGLFFIIRDKNVLMKSKQGNCGTNEKAFPHQLRNIFTCQWKINKTGLASRGALGQPQNRAYPRMGAPTEKRI